MPALGYAPGTLAMWLALAAGLGTIAVYVRAYTLQKAGGEPYEASLALGRRLYYAFATSILVASALLLYRLLAHDFRLSYVASYSGRDLPFRYLFSTFWAGQEGSFLLWLFFGAIIGFFVLRSAKEQEPPVMAVYVLSFLGIVAILVKQSPFRFLAEVPADGQGLNPLLQDPWMVIHPPVMFAGFASLSVPFAFAIGALWTKRWDGWVIRAMPWALFTFVCLGTAILMGGYWAYKTLGWGGYWAWDPVENTSLVPWLATTALVHGMHLQKAREKHRKINVILAIFAFCTILYGTFLTRSGVLADFSVHSFVDLGITGWLVAIILTFLFGGLALLAYRWREIPVVNDIDPATGKEKEEPFLSRSVLFILSVTLFSASGLVILLGTSAPIISRLWGKASQVTTSFYDVTHTPLAIVMAFLIALVPFVSWKGETWAAIGKKLAMAGIFALLGVVLFLFLGVRKATDLLFLGAAVFGMASSAEIIVLFVRRKAIRSAGGYFAHVGTAIMLVGILVSGAYEMKTQVTLERDKPLVIENHGRPVTYTFTGVYFMNEDGVLKTEGQLDRNQLSDRRAKKAMEVTVSEGKTVWKAYPKQYVNERSGQMMTNPDVRKSFFFDLYISPQSYEEGTPASMQGNVVVLRKGEEKAVAGMNVKFVDFASSGSHSQGGTFDIGTKLEVTSAGKTAAVTPKMIVALSGPDAKNESPATPLPGSTTGEVRISRVSVNDGAVELEFLGLETAGVAIPATPETLTIDVTTKPLIILVWSGFYVMMFGGFLSMLKRAGDARHAAIA
ncbi:MAG: cytochrome c biogenesis protein CcsA [Holophagales bacterium]|nr:cytochrome c biogenesis protein CcsA [Holophagales bacterium]